MALGLQLVDTIEAVSPDAWNACAGGHPFVQHAFLKALESSGALGVQQGVLPRYVLLKDKSLGLVACAPAMLKWGSLREFGPEIRWLRAGLMQDCFSWPKFQVGVPFFPVMGPKLLVCEGLSAAPLCAALIQGMQKLCEEHGRQSVFNILHIDKAMAQFCQAKGALVAGEWHAMWTNTGFADLPDYRARLPERKRYSLLKERRKAESFGLEFKVLRGRELTDEVLADYFEGHRRVCERYGGKPWLPASTYAAIAQGLAEATMLMGYFDGQRFVAGVMQLHAQAEQTVYALQWSEMEKLPAIALDLICHRPIDFALEHGIRKLDSGLVAAHKTMRGWHSEPVFHAHWFFNENLKSLAQKVLSKKLGL